MRIQVKIRYLFFVLLLSISLGNICCGPRHSPSAEIIPKTEEGVAKTEEVEPALAAYVPNFKEMTLAHVTQLDRLIPILQSGVITSKNSTYGVFQNDEFNTKPDWTTVIFTQVVNKIRLNALYSFVKKNEDPVLMDLDLNLLVARKDYTVDHNMNLYYGARFEIDPNSSSSNNTPLLNTEVAEGDNPIAVKRTLEKDFTTIYAKERNGYYQNEVVFRKGPIDLKNMNLILHFSSSEQRDRFLNIPDSKVAMQVFWNYQIHGNEISLLTKTPIEAEIIKY